MALLLKANRLIIRFIRQDVVLGGVFCSAQNQKKLMVLYLFGKIWR
jgi:hypothetical protein